MKVLTRYEIEILATYNAEVARGIVHTQPWNEKMTEFQESFDLMQQIQASRANRR